MEKLDLKQVRCQAKLIGTLVTVAGALLMTLYKGPIMHMVWTKYMPVHPHESDSATDDLSGKNWFMGCIFLIIATLAWASLFILQVMYIKPCVPCHRQPN